MPSNKTVGRKKAVAAKQTPAWVQVGLALTLVPLVAGLIMLGAWALDIDLTGQMESQIWVGILLMIISFTFSNLLQKKWTLFLGWLLLGIADFLLLIVVNFYVQIAALVLGAAGLILVGMEYFKRIRQNANR